MPSDTRSPATPNPSKMLADLFIMFPAIYFMNNIEWNPGNVEKLRVAYAIVNVILLCVLGCIYFLVEAKKDRRKIKVPASASWSDPSPRGSKDTTIQEYDKSQLQKAITQALVGAAIVSFLHFKWEIVPPLFLQCFLAPTQLYKNPLFKIWILGQKGEVEKRPFKEESPLGSLFPAQSSQTDETVEERQEDADENEQSNSLESKQNQETEEKTKKGSKQKKRKEQ